MLCVAAGVHAVDMFFEEGGRTHVIHVGKLQRCLMIFDEKGS